MRKYIGMASIVAVGLLQVTAATVGSLTPWKGGGFGMFSTIDSPSNRTIAVTGADVDGNAVRVRLPVGRFPDERTLSRGFLARLTAFPAQAHLVALARTILGCSFVRVTTARSIPERLALSRYGPSLSAISANDASREVDIVDLGQIAAAITLERVTVEVLGFEYSPADHQIRLISVARVEENR